MIVVDCADHPPMIVCRGSRRLRYQPRVRIGKTLCINPQRDRQSATSNVERVKIYVTGMEVHGTAELSTRRSRRAANQCSVIAVPGAVDYRISCRLLE